jgi:hypothetical protein
LKRSQSSKKSEEDEDDDKEENKLKQKRQKRGNESYLECLDTGNFKNTSNKTKKPNLLPDDDDEPTELGPSILKVVKLTISPVKVKVEKMGNEMVVSEKEQKQEKEDFEKIRQETGAQIGECFKMYMKVPPEQPEQEKKMKMKRTKPKINGVIRLLFALNLTN